MNSLLEKPYNYQILESNGSDDQTISNEIMAEEIIKKKFLLIGAVTGCLGIIFISTSICILTLTKNNHFYMKVTSMVTCIAGAILYTSMPIIWGIGFCRKY